MPEPMIAVPNAFIYLLNFLPKYADRPTAASMMTIFRRLLRLVGARTMKVIVAPVHPARTGTA